MYLYKNTISNTHNLKKILQPANMLLGKKSFLKKFIFFAIVLAIFCIFATTSEPSPFELEEKHATKKYIIMFISGTSEKVINEVKTQVIDSGGKIYQEFTIIPGFAAEMSEPVVQILKGNPNIQSIEEDKPVHASK